MQIIVPARRGSKGVPGKNTKKFRGYPLIEWSFAAAGYLADRIPDAHIICTSDDPEIAALISSHYADLIKFHQRPNKLADDHAGMREVMLDVCNSCDNARYILLQPTSPLRLTKDLNHFIHLLKTNPTVVSCTEPHEHPKDIVKVKYFNKISELENNINAFDEVMPIIDEDGGATRQSWGSQFRFIDGSLYCGSVETLQETKSFLPKNTLYQTLSNPASVDIDTPYDWVMAETQHDWLRENGEDFVLPTR